MQTKNFDVSLSLFFLSLIQKKKYCRWETGMQLTKIAQILIKSEKYQSNVNELKRTAYIHGGNKCFLKSILQSTLDKSNCQGLQ